MRLDKDMGHAHHQWLQDASHDIQRDYDRLYTKASDPKNTQAVGHENEALWEEFLSNWLPPQYEVTTRKYILGTVDTETEPFETDLIVFHPGYPRKLRAKTHIMAAGVAAAFSTKLTIRTSGLAEAAEHSAVLQRSLVQQKGRARQELWKPYVFGVLAASHSWKADASTPNDNISKCLLVNDERYALHPAESLDLVCIADLGTWGKSVHFQFPPENPGTDETLRTAHMELRDASLTPLALFLWSLYEFLSWRNDDMRGMAQDFGVTSGFTSGEGQARPWDASAVLTRQALALLRDDPFSRNGLDSWMQGVL